MTREQFLSGCEFKIAGDKFTSYKFIPKTDNTDSQPGHLVQITGNTSTVFREYHANVKAVTKTRFQCYNTICGQTARVWRKFSDFETV